MSDSPKVTVLMPVYNGEKHLREAIESILGQTFTDFEFLIINDGSTDKSVEIIKSYSDHRIKLVGNDKNLGLIATLNAGIDMARGEYIARMDCDDVSLPQRLEKQVLFMDSRPEIGVCGTWYRMIGESNKLFRMPEADNDIRRFMTINSAFAHPSVILRHRVLSEHNLRYNPEFLHAEDYEFWVRIAAYCKLANLPEVLILYRSHEGQVSTKRKNEQIAMADRVRKDQLDRFGIKSSDAESERYYKIDLEKKPIALFYMEAALSYRMRGFSESAAYARNLAKMNKRDAPIIIQLLISLLDLPYFILTRKLKPANWFR